jgi:hypothetical protein
MGSDSAYPLEGQVKAWKRLKILPLFDDTPLESIGNSLTRPR